MFAPAIYTLEHVQSGKIRTFGPVTGGWSEVEGQMIALGLSPVLWVLVKIEEIEEI